MSFLNALLSRRRLVLATTALLAFAGFSAWTTMPREEDPQFPEREGLLITIFPGADALTVERLVVEPVEEYLAEIEDINEVESTARAGVAIQNIELKDQIYDTQEVWDEVREAIDEARRDFPAGVLEPDLDTDLISQDAVVYALSGSADPLVLLDAAERLKRELLSVAEVKRVNVIADPGEQVVIEYDDATARRLGLDARALGAQLSSRSLIVPGGLIHVGEKTASLRPQTDFRSLEEIRATQILLPSGSAVPLGELARVRLGPEEPASERMRWNGEPALAIGVVPQDGLDSVRFGETLRALMAEIVPEVAPVQVEEIVFQPDLVESRLSELTGSLQLGMLIVAGILFLVMGPRLGLVVTLVVPLVAFGTIAIFAAGGGILHQISISALVIALGMLVDNAIVMAENIQYRIDQGAPAHLAAVESVKELAVPLGTATGTTLAAFVPMLISQGSTADFTRSIPVVIMTALAVSYVFAVTVTPVLSELLLKKAKAPEQASDLDKSRRGPARRLAGLAVSRSGWVLVGAVVLLSATVFASRWLDLKFFPPADRLSAIIELEMPEGTHLERTDAAAQQLERAMLERGDMRTVSAYVGRNGPKFYYNLLGQLNSPHRAMIIGEATTVDAIEPTLEWAREYVRLELPEASVVARRLEQGPPISAPVALRVMGQDLEDMEVVADELLGALKAIEGTRDVRHDLGLGVPTVRFEIDDAAAARYGVSRVDVAQALYGRTLGLEIGQYRVGEDPVPILVRSSDGEQLPASALATVDVARPGGDPVPLDQLARAEVEWLPAAIYHKDRTRVVTVEAQVADGQTVYNVLEALQPTLDALEFPPGVRLELGGELEESGKANEAIASKMPLGLLLLLFFLLLEFNSFRRVGIVLMTVPLAAVGVVPGLILSGNPFGFMSMLGVISLIGIVVNNAIVLLDVIERRREAGASIDEALVDAVERRTRPILLTMATTVAGLTPLAFAGATLWPPLAWAMISGLMASTVLTLMVIPALYKLFFTRPSLEGLGFRGARSAAAAASMAVVLLGGLLIADAAGAETVSSPAAADRTAESLSLDAAMALAVDRPASAAAALRAEGASSSALAAGRSARLPVIGVAADVTRRDRDFGFETPLGDFTLGERTSYSATLQVTQPLYVPSTRRTADAALEQADAAELVAGRTRQELAAGAAQAWLGVLRIDAAARSTEAFIESLEARLVEMEARVDAGRVLEADALKIRLDLESAELDRSRLAENRRVAPRRARPGRQRRAGRIARAVVGRRLRARRRRIRPQSGRRRAGPGPPRRSPGAARQRPRGPAPGES
ncbi:MAG: efflux RND transporter permease subunit, partial [Acidobacteriota bacterium]